MAISPKDSFPGKVDITDPNYPHGKARNVSDPNDGTGTPWVADLINDIFGFQQALLEAARMAPSGAPEHVSASQYLDAIRAITRAGGLQLLSEEENASGTYQIIRSDVGSYIGWDSDGNLDLITENGASIELDDGGSASVINGFGHSLILGQSTTDLTAPTFNVTSVLNVQNSNSNAVKAQIGDWVFVSGAGGLGLYYGSAGNYNSGIEISSQGRVTIRSDTGNEAALIVNENDILMRYDSSTTCAQIDTPANGGFLINNQSTGTGLERALTTSDLTTIHSDIRKVSKNINNINGQRQHDVSVANYNRVGTLYQATETTDQFKFESLELCKWFSVGKTGSKADFIWKQLDNLPDNTKFLYLKAFVMFEMNRDDDYYTLQITDHLKKKGLYSVGLHSRPGVKSSQAGGFGEFSIMYNALEGVLFIKNEVSKTDSVHLILGHLMLSGFSVS